MKLYYDTQLKEITQLKSFTSSEPLEDYIGYIQLPGGLEVIHALFADATIHLRIGTKMHNFMAL